MKRRGEAMSKLSSKRLDRTNMMVLFHLLLLLDCERVVCTKTLQGLDW